MAHARDLAQSALEDAAFDLNALPDTSDHHADLGLLAAKAQASATVAAAQALLEIGDILREHFTRGGS